MSGGPVEHRPHSRFDLRRSGRAPAAAVLTLVAMLIPALVAGAAVNDNTVVSVDSAGALASGASGPGVVVSANGRYVDPFRPQIEPDGFDSPQAVREDRARHLAAVRRMFAELDYFVFTFGLTETWLHKPDGAALPLAPGVAGGECGTELVR